MPRIAVQPEWTAEYEIDRDGEVLLSQVECEGEVQPWKRVPDVVDKLLCDAARAEEAQRLRDLPGEIADQELQERKDGERP